MAVSGDDFFFAVRKRSAFSEKSVPDILDSTHRTCFFHCGNADHLAGPQTGKKQPGQAILLMDQAV